MNIGFDYDGTLSGNSKLNFILKALNWFSTKNYIITSNVANIQRIKVEYIDHYNVDVYAGNKTKLINELQIDLYFEDNPVEAKIIEKECPNCKVILVNLDWYELNNTSIITTIKIKE